MELLIKLLPKLFDDNSCKLRSFIKQIDSIIECVIPSQEKFFYYLQRKELLAEQGTKLTSTVISQQRLKFLSFY